MTGAGMVFIRHRARKKYETGMAVFVDLKVGRSGTPFDFCVFPVNEETKLRKG